MLLVQIAWKAKCAVLNECVTLSIEIIVWRDPIGFNLPYGPSHRLTCSNHFLYPDNCVAAWDSVCHYRAKILSPLRLICGHYRTMMRSILKTQRISYLGINTKETLRLTTGVKIWIEANLNLNRSIDISCLSRSINLGLVPRWMKVNLKL